jgi:hypothetical protein
MSTPPRLVQLQCPACQAHHWEIDCDYRGAELVGKKELSYAERTYRCPNCGTSGTGYQVSLKSPPAFFLQPHPMYPMSAEEFDHWVAVLREHFPDHPLLRELGTRWYVPRRRRRHRLRNVTALYSWFRRKLDL